MKVEKSLSPSRQDKTGKADEDKNSEGEEEEKESLHSKRANRNAEEKSHISHIDEKPPPPQHIPTRQGFFNYLRKSQLLKIISSV